MMSHKDGIKKYDQNCQDAYAKAAEAINKITNKEYDEWIQKIRKACKS